MGLWERFKDFNYRMFCTEEGDEPGLAWQYMDDGKGNKGFKWNIWGMGGYWVERAPIETDKPRKMIGQRQLIDEDDEHFIDYDDEE